MVTRYVRFVTILPDVVLKSGVNPSVLPEVWAGNSEVLLNVFLAFGHLDPHEHRVSCHQIYSIMVQGYQIKSEVGFPFIREIFGAGLESLEASGHPQHL